MSVLPIGTILMYDGTGIAEVETREVEIGAHVSDTIEMVGWFVCNGLVNTPNLEYRFIRGHFTSCGTGGSNDSVVVEHNHTASQVAHVHNVDGLSIEGTEVGIDIANISGTGSWQMNRISSVQPVITVDNEGVSGVGANMPSYYNVIFIIRKS